MATAVNSKTLAAREEREFYELKQKAAQFYSNNGVPSKVEDILNSMFFDNPDDVYGHLANYFETFAKTPTISKLQARQAVDSKGNPTIQTDVYCTVKNKQKLITSSVCSSYSYLPDSAKVEEREADETERQAFVKEALRFINEEFSEKLQNIDPVKQSATDEIISAVIEALRSAEEERLAAELEAPSPVGIQPSEIEAQPTGKKAKSPKGKGAKSAQVVIIQEEPRENFIPGCNSLCAVSQAVCAAGASVKDVPLYEHIASLVSTEAPGQYSLPLPLVTILQSGKSAAGKLKCIKEFMVTPKPGMPFKEAVQHILNINNHVVKSLGTKGGVAARFVGDLGAVCPQLDRPEQGLDLLQEAITSQGLKAGEDFHIVLNIAGPELFDYDKGKYEVVAGQMKGFDDMADFWAELLGRYPSIIGLIDPMRKQESDSWYKLCEKVSDHCYIIGDYVNHRPGLLKDEAVSDGYLTSAVVLKLEQMNTITDIISGAQKYSDKQQQIIISACQGETTDSFIADLAVGLGARFLKVGAPCRGERVSKLNRLLQIEDSLEMEGKLSYLDAHVFPKLEKPVPPELENVPEETEPKK